MTTTLGSCGKNNTSADSFEELNEVFHDKYTGARRHADRDEPVLVVLADTLTLFRHNEVNEQPFTPQTFHVIKAVAHAPIALFAALHSQQDNELSQVLRNHLLALREHLTRSEASLQKIALESTAGARLHMILERSRAFLDHIIETSRTSSASLATFARSLGSVLLDSTNDATGIQLCELHTCASELLAPLSPEEWSHLEVIIAGNHQARARSLPLQYFAKLLGEPLGAECRIAYAEAISNAQDALALAGTRRLDRAIADAFFADPKRLQRDVLGDAAHARLRDIVLKSTGCELNASPAKPE